MYLLYRLFTLGFVMASGDRNLVIRSCKDSKLDIKLQRYCNNQASISRPYTLITKKGKVKIDFPKCSNNEIVEYDITIDGLDSKADVYFNRHYLSKKLKLKRFIFPLQYNTYRFGPIRCIFLEKGISCKDLNEEIVQQIELSSKLKSYSELYIKSHVYCNGGESYIEASEYSLKIGRLIQKDEVNIKYFCYNGISSFAIYYNSGFKESKLSYRDQVYSEVFSIFSDIQLFKYVVYCTVGNELICSAYADLYM